MTAKVKLIDCVGYLIDGVNGHMEDGNERMVKTPWFDHEIPFAKAAQIGTEKVIREHATIGILVTTDGSFTDIPRKLCSGRRTDGSGAEKSENLLWSC